MNSLTTVAVVLFLALPMYATDSQIKFVEMKTYQELETLRPQLEATFRISCSEKFLRVIRHETVDSETGQVTIFIGGLVEVPYVNFCPPGSDRDITVRAGETFSGREYKVDTITDGNEGNW